jgi:hypothetical protein
MVEPQRKIYNNTLESRPCLAEWERYFEIDRNIQKWSQVLYENRSLLFLLLFRFISGWGYYKSYGTISYIHC